MPVMKFLKTKTIYFLAFAASAFAESRDYAQPCADVYRRAVQTFAAAHFEPTVSDATAGVLTLKFTGEPMVYNFRYTHAKPYLIKYAVGGEKLHYRGLTFTNANATLAPTDTGCRVTLGVGLAGVNIEPVLATKTSSARWDRTYRELKSNGAAEREFLDKMMEVR